MNTKTQNEDNAIAVVERTPAERAVSALGNAIKYIWRAGLKSDDAIQDLEKARQYLDFEIERLKEISK